MDRSGVLNIITRTPRRTAPIAVLLAVVVAFLVAPGRATGDSQDRTNSSGSAPALTAEDIAAFLDGLIPVQLREHDIAGAVIAVVKDGKVLFARGYGYADVETRKPVSTDSTLFRLASISKLFTCTAVMQLVEQGKVDLDRDVNEYLDFQIPSTYPQPITLRNLMTHTAGFQETIRGLVIPEGGKILTLKEYLPQHVPPRIFAPGTTPAYSNYGNALAGYIVERVSGQSFEDYIEEHIFRPLGMKNATYAQPLPEALKPMMSSGYVYGSGPAKPFETIQTFPGGGSSATADDVARFMIAHLQDGRLGDARILNPATAQAMHGRQFELVPSMNGSAFGFAEQSRNGYRVISHGGDLRDFHSQLLLVPELNLGFFFSQNSLGQANLRAMLWRTFFDRYFPSARTIALNGSQFSNSREIAGLYKATRRFDVSVLKLRSLMGQVRVSANSDGTISADLVGEFGRSKPLHEVAPMKYCDEKEEDCIAFMRDEAGKLRLIGDFPHVIFQRVPWYEERTLNLPVLIASGIVFGLTLVLWPIAAITRRHYGFKLNLTGPKRFIRMSVRIVCALDLAFILAGRALFLNLPSAKLELWVHVVQVAGILGAVGTVVVIYDAVLGWNDPARWWFSRVASVVLAVACLGFVAFAINWNLFHFSTRY